MQSTEVDKDQLIAAYREVLDLIDQKPECWKYFKCKRCAGNFARLGGPRPKLCLSCSQEVEAKGEHDHGRKDTAARAGR